MDDNEIEAVRSLLSRTDDDTTAAQLEELDDKLRAAGYILLAVQLWAMVTARKIEREYNARRA